MHRLAVGEAGTMTVFLFLISVYAALLGPVVALGGVATGLLWALNRPTWACVTLSTSLVALGFRSSMANPEATIGDHVYFIGTHLCAMALWIVFTVVMSKLLPEETPAGRRVWLQKRARLGAFDTAIRSTRSKTKARRGGSPAGFFAGGVSGH